MGCAGCADPYSCCLFRLSMAKVMTIAFAADSIPQSSNAVLIGLISLESIMDIHVVVAGTDSPIPA